MVSLVLSVTVLGLVAEPLGDTPNFISICDGVFRKFLGLSEFFFIRIGIGLWVAGYRYCMLGTFDALIGHVKVLRT